METVIDPTSDMTVRARNSRGEFHASLQISKDVRIGEAMMSKGHWPKLCGGSSINATILGADADMASGAALHDNPVYLSATAEPIDKIEHTETTL